MDRSYRLKPFRRALIIVFLAAVGFTVAGFLTGDGFLGNILAEMAGNAIGIFIGIFLVDRLAERRRELQWHRVWDLTLGAIATNLCNVAAYLHLDFPALEDTLGLSHSGHHNPNRATLVRLEELANELHNLKNTEDMKALNERGVKFFEMSRWDLNQIQSVLIPRALQFCEDQPLIDILIEFDDAYRRLHNAVSFRNYCTEPEVYRSICILARVAVRLYQHLCEDWERERETSKGKRMG